MNKKYKIVNSNSYEDYTIFYVLYIVLFFVVIFIIYKIILNFNQSESFVNIENEKKLSSEQLLLNLQEKNNELNNFKNTLEEKLNQQALAVYVNQNFNKVDSSSFNDELSFLLADFANTTLPEINMKGKYLIQTQSEFNNVLAEANNMKNIYQPGDLVTTNSTFNLTKDDICYRSNGKPIKANQNFMNKYPNCMVCSVEGEKNLKNTATWNDTRTNINQVCLYNPSAEANSGIPNLEQCQQFCGITNKTF
jgi:ABC-type maltose transport system permease subunit